jgi:hypothetical protein
MLKKYSKYLNSDVLNESHIKPDPDGYINILKPISYNKIFMEKSNELLAKAKKETTDYIIFKLKEDFIGKLISLHENGKQRIIDVKDIIIGNKGIEYYPVLIDSEDEKKKIKYEWEKDVKIFNIGNFLDFFEENFIDEYIMFLGRPVKGGESKKYNKIIKRIGVHNGVSQDFLIVECDDNTTLLLFHDQPIKILDKKLKEIDPYGEENWDN